MSDELRPIAKSTAQAICDAVKAKEGTTEGIPFNLTLADRITALPTSNKPSKLIERTVTELTAEDFAEVTKIGNYAFCTCNRLTSVTIPDSVTSIGSFAFDGCSNLTSVTIPDSVTSIGDVAFRDCKMTSIIIPNSVTSIGGRAFDGCSNLTSVTIPNNVTSIGGSAFEDCIFLTSATIGQGVTDINSYMFNNCVRLSAISLGDNIKTIKNYAFIGCETLQYVTLPASLTSLGAYVFRKEKRFTHWNKWTLNFLGTTPPIIESNTFFNVKTDFEKIIVPKGCGEAYKTATNWANFADFIEEATE